MANYHDFSDLERCISGWKIRGKVQRVFRVPVNQTYGLGIILANSQGERIECYVHSKFVEHYERFLKENNWISVMIFDVAKNIGAVRATNHPFKIRLRHLTVVRKIDPPAEEPANRFTPFDTVFDKTVDDSVLVDVIGVLFDVGDLENDGADPNNSDGLRLSFSIRGACARVLKCMAVGRTAKEFHDNYAAYNGKPLIAVLQMWKVNRWFDGDKNVRIESAGPISKVIPDPDCPEVVDVKFMLSWFLDSDEEGKD